MCGIAGYIGKRFLTEEVANATLDLMHSRGPDSCGKIRHHNENTHIILLHSRLSLIGDEVSSRQPVSNDKYSLVFNGEIYNYLELLSEYSSIIDGSDSDTQILFSLLCILPLERVLSEIDGMWALVLYDNVRKCLILCRDLFGEKPLYYHQTTDGIYFGSSPQYIAALRQVPNTPNYSSVTRFLLHDFPQYAPDDSTFANDILACKAGSYITINSDLELKQTIYTPFQKNQQSNEIDLDYFVPHLYSKMEEAILRRFRADHPLTLFLSGGIDSSAILSIASKHSIPINTISIRTNDVRYNESNMIDILINKFHCKHTYVNFEEIQNSSHDLLYKISNQYYSPLPSSNYILYNYMCALAAKSGSRIVMMGTGGDELFAGYLYHWKHYFASLESDPETSGLQLRLFKETVVPLIRDSSLYNFDVNKLNPGSFSDYNNIDSSIFKTYTNPITLIGSVLNLSSLKEKLNNDMFNFTLPPHLIASDMVAMSHSLENRSPLLSWTIYSLARSIPDKYLMHYGFNKYIMRLMFKNYLPYLICFQRDKIGFNCAYNPKYSLDFQDIFFDMSRNNFLQEIVDFNVLSQYANLDSLSNSYSKLLFRLISCHILTSL